MSDEKMYLVTYRFRSGDMEDVDKVIFSEEDVRKFGDNTRKNHAHLVDSQYYLWQDRHDWEEEHGHLEYAFDDGSDWLRVSYGEGIARIYSIEPISAEEVKVLRKWSVA
tara:strand:- start:5035 stop:5361 length:327 start_codon:yes stop_codon:yes gene_type:complete